MRRRIAAGGIGVIKEDLGSQSSLGAVRSGRKGKTAVGLVTSGDQLVYRRVQQHGRCGS